MKSVALLLFLSTAFSLTRVTKSSNEYNVTNTSNDTIFGILQTLEPQNVAKLFESLEYSDPADDHTTTPYRYNFTWLWNLRTEEEVTFCNIRLARASNNISRVRYGFHDNKMRLHSGQFHVNLSGDMIINKAHKGYFEAAAYFNGFTIDSIRQPNTNGNSFLIEDVQYDQMDITCEDKLNFPSGRMNLRRILPSILRTVMNRNQKFRHALDEIYDKYAASSLIQTTKLSNDYYVTKFLNDTIVGIFQTAEPQNIAKLMGNLVYLDPVDDIRSTPYEYLHTSRHGNTFLVRFLNIRTTYASSNNSRASFGFLKNEIQIYSPQLIINLTGIVNLTGPEDNNIFNAMINFNGFTINAIRQPKISDNSWLIDLQYENHADIQLQIPYEPAMLTYCQRVIKSSLLDNRERVLLPILRTHINRNKKLMQAFSELFDTNFTDHSISPHFTGHEHIHYYLIPNIPIGSINLKDIAIRGLLNYHSLKFTSDCNGFVTYRLLINNIRGSMILEDASGAVMSCLELHYYIGSFTIFITRKINRISVKAENYFIVETKSNTSLTKLQSDIMMDQVERAFGSSLMPSMEYQSISRPDTFSDIHELETIIRQMLTEKVTHSNKPTADTQKLHKNPTLFDDSSHSTNQIHSREEKITPIQNHYHISLHDINIHLISGNPEYSDKIQCAPIGSEFTHRINVSPSGKISTKTNETGILGVTLHFKYPSVNLSSIKSRNYENDSCEFQIRNNRDIQVELSPPMNITGSSEQHKIQKRIDATLMSMTKERIIHTLKPIVCLPFDVCTQTANMIDDYFRKFVDIVLKKCSLRKNTPVGIMKYHL